jgi:hypothetical protein
VGTWHDPDLGRPIAAPLERCAELLGVDLATVRELAAKVEPYVRADGTRIWSLMQLERHLVGAVPARPTWVPILSDRGAARPVRGAAWCRPSHRYEWAIKVEPYIQADGTEVGA